MVALISDPEKMERSVPDILSNVEALRTDAAIAQELRDEVAPHLSAICRAMNKARAAGLVLNFNIAPDQYGRFRSPEISIVKPL